MFLFYFIVGFLVVGVLFFIFSRKKEEVQLKELRFVIVTSSWNNVSWYKKNLDSTTQQNYSNYHIIYTDDNSTDGTADCVRSYIEKYQLDKITLLCNKERLGQTANNYNAVHMLKDSDIALIVDGDDWLAHKNVLKKLNKVYQDQNVWLTYGQHKVYPYFFKKGLCDVFPEDVVRQGAYRSYKWVSSHLRTFRAGLFKKIKREDFMHEGTFLPASNDMVEMFSMLEMAQGKFSFIPEVLLVYNIKNPLAVWNINQSGSVKMQSVVRSQKKYKPLDSAPWKQKQL